MKEYKFLILIVLGTLILNINFISADCNETQVDINSASLEDLERIIKVGEKTAPNIIDARPFNSLDDLINVTYIGEIKLQDIKDEGLACVISEESDEDSEEEEDAEENPEDSEENKNNKPSGGGTYFFTLKLKNNPNISKINEIIKLNPKDINKGNNFTKLDKNSYALIGLGGFSVLMIILFTFKYLKSKKNEFK